MPVSNSTKNHHLLNRAGFGLNTEIISSIETISPKDVFKLLQEKSAAKPTYFDVADNTLKGIMMGVKEAGMNDKPRLSDDQKKVIRQQSRDDIKNLNLTWMREMVNSEAQLREKMAFFWHGHFACRDINIFFQQKMLHEIRSNALENFADLLRLVSKSASMLSFLNNQQNRKAHPNENFAREVMELFTLGRDNGYTEKDIKEAARAFTGWSFTFDGEFIYRKGQHDNGTKTILGKTGNFDGDDVLNILLENKQTAKYITQKIYRFFVNEEMDNEKVNWLAERFYQSGYNISTLMADIFTSKWFYDEKNIGSNIKSPVQLLAGIQRLLPIQFSNEEVLLIAQRVLGQVLFYPPNVAGWPGGKNWIDSSSLMFRLRLPQLIKDNDAIGVTAKADDDVQMGMKESYKQKVGMGAIARPNFNIEANIDWETYIGKFKNIPREQLYKVLEQVVLSTRNGTMQKATVESFIDASSRENYIKTATVAFMSTPEYQMC